MCGRISLTKAIEPVEKRFKVKYSNETEWPIYYNGAPSHQLPVITNSEPDRVQLFHWGLIPSWSDEPKTKYATHNARAETVHKSAAFRGPFKRQRCLVVADGFYEWKKTNEGKQPYRIILEGEQLFAFAGLWDHWENENQSISSFTIITTQPNELMKEIHNRMPVILPKDIERDWLDTSFDTSELKNMLIPYPGDDLTAYPVSKAVNIPTNNFEEIIKPLGSSGEQLTI